MEVIIFLAISALVIWLVFRLVDSSGPTQFGYGIVVGKKFIKGYWQTTYVTTTHTNGNGCTSTSTFPVTSWIPDSYVLRIHVANRIVDQSVSEEFYKSIKEGETIPVEYAQGRLSKNKVFIRKVRNNIV